MVAKEQFLRGYFEAPKGASEAIAQEPTHQLERDKQGRIWYDQPASQALLFPDRPGQRSVLTASGLRFLNQLERDEKRRLLSDAVQRRLNGQLIHLWGTEGNVRKVNDLPPDERHWISKIAAAVTRRATGETGAQSEPSTLTAVEKSFTQKNALTGWEMAYLIDELHLRGKNPNEIIREMSGLDEIRILQPLGGTNKDLYMPFLDGITLEDYFDWMFEHHKSLGKLITAGMREYSHRVRTAMYYHLVMLLGEHGFDPHDNELYQYKFIDGYSHFAQKLSHRQQLVLDVFIDVHPMGNHPFDRYRNWMMSPEVLEACQQILEDNIEDSAKVEQILSLLVNTAIIFDPIYIRQRKERIS